MNPTVKKTELFIKNILKASSDLQNVFTPFELCDEVLDKVPSLDGHILVVSNLEFVYSLKRRGVNMNNVSYLTPCPIKQKVAEKMGVVKCYMYEGIPTKELFDEMKFDVVVGNPPYSITMGDGRTSGTKKRLYALFFELFNESPNYGIIIPSNWIGRTSDSTRNTIINDVRVSVIMDTTSYFKDDINGIPTCAVIKHNSHNRQLKTLIADNGKKYEVAPGELISLKIGPYLTIFRKINHLSKMSMLWRRNVNSGLTRSSPLLCDTKTEYPVVLVTGPKINQEPTVGYSSVHVNQQNITSHKVVMNTNASITDIGAIKIVPPGFYTTDSVVFFPCDNSEECNNIKSYLESTFVRFVVLSIRNSHGNSKSFFSKVPCVDFSRSWTDVELYEHFNFTQEEIELIEGTIK